MFYIFSGYFAKIIGDEILFLPTLKTLKSAFKNVHLTLALEPRSKQIKYLTTYINRLTYCDVKGKHKFLNLLKLLLRIWFRRYDIVVASGSSPFVSLFLFFTGIRKRYGYNTGILSKLLLSKAIPLNKEQYAANMYHDLTKGIIENEKSGPPEIQIPAKELVWANQRLQDSTKKRIVIHPGVSKLSMSKNMVKTWSVKNWAELIKKLVETGNYRIILTGGPDDEYFLQLLKSEIARYGFKEDDVLDLYGQTCNIAQLAAIINLSALLICVDSAPMHIAVGVKTPLIAIFGPTDDKKLLPDDFRFTTVKNDYLECRPCLWEKRQTTCDELFCLQITPEKVIRIVEDKIRDLSLI